MNKVFVKTQNVKNFIGLVENLINKPKNIPKMGLVYGEPGLGKSQTALWLACKYDGVYLRASNLMTGRWLLEEMVKELDEIPRFLSSDNFNVVVKKLKQNPQIIFIDEIDYLMNNYKSIETLRDIHDETGCPIIFIGMGLAHRKLERYKHLYDRFSEVLKFETFGVNDLSQIINQLSEIPRFLSSDNYNLVVKKLKQNPQIIFIDEIDYLMNNYKSIETLRDIHDETGCPIIFIGMGLAHRKLERYKHLYDRFSEILKFESFRVNDLSQIIGQLSEIPFTPDSIEYIHTKFNRFRQIVQLINQMETFAKDNNLTEITKEIMEQIL